MDIEQVIAVLIVVLGAPAIQLAKNRLGLDGKAALWLSGIVSLILAMVALGVVGDLVLTGEGVPAIFQLGSTVFAVATLVYRQLMAKKD